MRTAMMAAAAALVAGAALALFGPFANGAEAPQQAVTRTDLQRHDLSTPGWETVHARVDIAPGATAPRHKHPGEEVIYVLQGTLVYEFNGKPPVTLKAGDVLLFVPYGVVHSAKNIGNDTGSELATYVVEKGKPLVVPVP